MPQMILFLDIDGVLHPFAARHSDRLFTSIAHLWSILERLPEVSVVITSAWRERHALPELVAMLVAQGGGRYAQRFVGATPVLDDGSGYKPGTRQRETEAWLAEHAPGSIRHLILDDIETEFSPDCPCLYLVDGATGLTAKDVDAVVARLRDP